MGQVKAGRVRALAITTPARHPAWPDLPTMREAGFSDMDIALWAGILAPAETPPAVVRKLQDEVARVLKLPDVRERILALGIDPVASTPEEFNRLIAADIAKWTAVAKAANTRRIDPAVAGSRRLKPTSVRSVEVWSRHPLDRRSSDEATP